MRGFLCLYLDLIFYTIIVTLIGRKFTPVAVGRKIGHAFLRALNSIPCNSDSLEGRALTRLTSKQSASFMKLKLGEIYRTRRPYSPKDAIQDDLPNFFHYTYSENQESMLLLEKGISYVRSVSAEAVWRRPVIALRTNPHKVGTADTPWQNFFDLDRGYARYFGDNKAKGPAKPAECASGNKVLLSQFDLYQSNCPHTRALAAPLVFFQSVPFGRSPKGAVQFLGFGLIQRIERVSQGDTLEGTSFSNYAFELVLFDMHRESDTLDWRWITDRRCSLKSADETLKEAPHSWKLWVREGASSLEKVRRRVSRFTIARPDAQRNMSKKESDALTSVMEFYSGKKLRFEALASHLTAKYMYEHGTKYVEGWITKASSDGGKDFVGRIDVGEGFEAAKLVVIGQAKCEQANSGTHGNHIARTVARLKRGWVGVYVTTSFFSVRVQEEILEDQYPLVLINGKCIAGLLCRLSHDAGVSVIDYITQIDKRYEAMLSNKTPEQILHP